jgi:hypothetical protein
LWKSLWKVFRLQFIHLFAMLKGARREGHSMDIYSTPLPGASTISTPMPMSAPVPLVVGPLSAILTYPPISTLLPQLPPQQQKHELPPHNPRRQRSLQIASTMSVARTTFLLRHMPAQRLLRSSCNHITALCSKPQST